jgi:hypothetical protein
MAVRCEDRNNACFSVVEDVKQRGGLMAATETLGKFGLVASASAIRYAAETGSGDAIGVQRPRIAPSLKGAC